MPRKKEPTEVLRLRGSWAAAGRAGEPDHVPDAPDPPEWLSVNAMAVWTEFAAILTRMGLWSESYREGLILLVLAVAESRRLSQECTTAPVVVTSPRTGTQRINPLLKARDVASERALKLLKEFGLTPATKVNVRSEPKPAPSGKSRFFWEGQP